MLFFLFIIAIHHDISTIDSRSFFTNRSYLLNRPTITEHHIASRIANAMDNQEHNTVDDPLVRAHLKKKSKWTTTLVVHYTHEARLESYNSKGRLVHRRPHQNNHQ